MKVVSLNKARKANARAGAKAQADANAVKFGRTKGEKMGDAMRAERMRREWEGKRR